MHKTHTPTRKPTVLHVIPDERLGGPQFRVLQVSRSLKDRGFNSIVLIPRGDSMFANLLKEAGIPVIRPRTFRRIRPTLNPLSHLLWLVLFLPSVLSIARFIRSERVDIVQTGVSPRYLQGPIAARLAGAKLVWFLEGIETSSMRRAAFSPFFRLLANRMAGASQAVVTSYFQNGERAKRMAVLYPPVDTSRFRPDDSNNQAYRQEFGIAPDEKVVGIVGNLNYLKGHEYFIMAAGKVKQSFPDVKFLVVGKRIETQERYWQRINGLISETVLQKDVILAGHRMDMPGIMNLMDILVLSSVLEAAPTVIMEAMACAKPVVATRVGGVPELVLDGETGLLVPPRETEALSKAILQLLNDPEMAREMGAKGRQKAAEQLDISICAQRHEEVYAEVLRQPE